MAGELRLGLAEAAALGVLQGLTEVLPVSSSGHLALVPAMLHRPYAQSSPAVRKGFEVALHGGSGLGLALARRRELASLAHGNGRDASLLVLAAAPAAVAGFALERPIEQRLGGMRSVAAAQLVAGATLAAADRRPATRRLHQVTVLDALVVGLAQATALVPGVSRLGATLTAGRALGLRREAAATFSRRVALPVVAGAMALKAVRLGRGEGGGGGAAHAVGGAAAFVTSVACARLIPRFDEADSWAAFGVYRMALGAAALGAAAAARTD